MLREGSRKESNTSRRLTNLPSSLRTNRYRWTTLKCFGAACILFKGSVMENLDGPFPKQQEIWRQDELNHTDGKQQHNHVDQRALFSSQQQQPEIDSKECQKAAEPVCYERNVWATPKVGLQTCKNSWPLIFTTYLVKRIWRMQCNKV